MVSDMRTKMSAPFRSIGKLFPAYAEYEKNRLSLYREAAKEAEDIMNRWTRELDDDYEPKSLFRLSADQTPKEGADTIQLDTIYTGDSLEVLKTLPDESVHCCVTSPPYYALRDYGVEGQIGRETTRRIYLTPDRSVCRSQARSASRWYALAQYLRHLRWKGQSGRLSGYENPKGRTGQAVALNHKVEGCKPKDLIGIPWMLAFALRDEGWYLRNDIIWMKENPMPESCKDRCSRCYEHIFLLSKSRRYFFDYKAISEPIATGNGRTAKTGHERRKQYGKAVPGQYQPQTINAPVNTVQSPTI